MIPCSACRMANLLQPFRILSRSGSERPYSTTWWSSSGTRASRENAMDERSSIRKSIGRVSTMMSSTCIRCITVAGDAPSPLCDA